MSLYVLVSGDVKQNLPPYCHLCHTSPFRLLLHDSKEKTSAIKMLKHISCTHKNSFSALADVTHTTYLSENTALHTSEEYLSLWNDFFFFSPDVLLIKYSTWHYDNEETDTNRCAEL